MKAELERERAAGADERRGYLEQIDRMTATIERLAAEAQLSWIERLLLIRQHYTRLVRRHIGRAPA